MDDLVIIGLSEKVIFQQDFCKKMAAFGAKVGDKSPPLLFISIQYL
jgi:hypothetical protein